MLLNWSLTQEFHYFDWIVPLPYVWSYKNFHSWYIDADMHLDQTAKANSGFHVEFKHMLSLSPSDFEGEFLKKLCC